MMEDIKSKEEKDAEEDPETEVIQNANLMADQDKGSVLRHVPAAKEDASVLHLDAVEKLPPARDSWFFTH